ncbi:MAG: copper amine oxidase [Oceanospirillum sp.]|nr:copper amine oxidase [Oceanospirillum sp.]
MKKILLGSSLLTLFLTSIHSVQAAEPVWLEGKTEQSYAIQVYHSPTCGCCKGWVDHLKDHNFKVESIEMHDVTPIKQKLGVPQQGASCHTAVVNGKVIEGHVPAQDIKQLLSAESDIRLLTVPGMPSGGPGMDYEGARKDAFKVFAVTEQGKVSTFNQYQDY